MHLTKHFNILSGIVICILVLVAKSPCAAQSPEILLREFASGQIKKGVRSIGMGGDGATWGNYSLVWKDSSTALLDAGITSYTNSNAFSFTAVGYTTPALWHKLAIYVIALSQNANNISASVKSAGLGSGPVAVHGNGNNQAIFVKAALPLDKHWSVGVLLSYERSQFYASPDNSLAELQYRTNWLPSGGFGISWQPNDRILIGFRGLFNQDMEIKKDDLYAWRGINLSHEYRLGISYGIWKGALIDVGGNFRYRYNKIADKTSTDVSPNVGIEQNMWKQHLALRCGMDESSGTAGFSLRSGLFTLDAAYVYNLGIARLGDIYGSYSNSVITTLTFHYGRYRSVAAK